MPIKKARETKLNLEVQNWNFSINGNGNEKGLSTPASETLGKKHLFKGKGKGKSYAFRIFHSEILS